MRQILIKEICNEKPNSAALGAFNSVVERATKIINEGRSGGETKKQIIDYLRTDKKVIIERSKNAFESIRAPKRKFN